MLIVRVKSYLGKRETLLIYITSVDTLWKFITALPYQPRNILCRAPSHRRNRCGRRRAGVVMTRKGGSYKSVKPPLQGSQALQPLYRAAVICLWPFRSPSFVSSAPAHHPFHQSVPIFIMSIFTLPLCGRVEQETARRNMHVVAPAIRKPDFRVHRQAELSLSLDKMLTKLSTLELMWGDPAHARRVLFPKINGFQCAPWT